MTPSMEPAHQPTSAPVEITIDAASRPPLLDLAALWAHRDLLLIFVWRDLRVRYAHTMLGVGWALAQPLLTAIILWIVFSRLAGRAPGGAAPGLAFYFSGTVVWTFCAAAINNGVNSVVANQALISKVYFPRALIPLAATATPIVDMAFATVVLGALLALQGALPSVSVLLAVPAALLAIAAALGINLWLSALNVRFRDVRSLAPFLLQVWFFASPIAYSSALIPERWRAFYAVNPLATAVEGFRFAWTGDAVLGPVWPAALATALLVVSGLAVFSRLERSFADAV